MSEFQESTSITFEWTIRDLKTLFESTKGDSKSKVTKSVRFSGGRWQILFYANSGTEGGFVSLYLSCEPTTEEKDSALDGKWVRDGVFKFSFELRSTTKTVLFNVKEANNHSFSWKTANWGWAQFARRDNVYFHSSSVKDADAFVVICTITSSPVTPVLLSTIPRQPVPKDLLETIGSLLDDPLYSDVEFVFPRRGRSVKNPRKIWANRKLIERTDYFKAMFGSGFAETSDITASAAGDTQSDIDDATSETPSFSSSKWTRHFEDSDDEDDEMFIHSADDIAFESVLNSQTAPPSGILVRRDSVVSLPSPAKDTSEDSATVGSDNETEGRNVRPKLSHPSSPGSRTLPIERQEPEWQHIKSEPLHGPSKLRVVVKDVAYTTYRAVLYYIYTDTIVFAPLSSSFNSFNSSQIATSSSVSLPAQLLSESQNNISVTRATQGDVSTKIVPNTRRSWIAEWQSNNPERPTPCSAKAVYRLADKLDLHDLKERAFQHIEKSLTVENIAYEVFSPFSAAFADVRKVQVEFFLQHWADIRASDAMSNVWTQIRVGRHPGFEEVWPVIAQNLEFKPRMGNTADGLPAN